MFTCYGKYSIILQEATTLVLEGEYTGDPGILIYFLDEATIHNYLCFY